MRKTKIILIIILFFIGSFSALKFTRSYFSDTEVALGNSIQVGTWGTTSPETPPTETPTPTQEAPTPTPTPTSTPSNLADHVVISEIMVKGDSADDEFIELYNPTGSEVNLSSWSIQYRGGDATTYYRKNFVTSNIIPAHGFLLIGNTAYNGSVSLDMVHNTFSLSSDGGTVFLVNNQTTLTDATDNGPTAIDKVAYGVGTHLRPEGSAYIAALDANQSLERKAYSTSDVSSMIGGSDATKGNAYDSEDNASDFVLRTTSQPQNTSSTTEIP